MKLSELKEMVKEEYALYLSEQEAGEAPTPPVPPTPQPAISVADDDIQMGADADDILRNIFDMLKSHFEGEDAAPVAGGPAVPPTPPTPPTPTPDTPDNDTADADGDDDEDTVEEGNYGGAYGAKGTNEGDKKLHEGFTARLKKLANIKG